MFQQKRITCQFFYCIGSSRSHLLHFSRIFFLFFYRLIIRFCKIIRHRITVFCLIVLLSFPVIKRKSLNWEKLLLHSISKKRKEHSLSPLVCIVSKNWRQFILPFSYTIFKEIMKHLRVHWNILP